MSAKKHFVIRLIPPRPTFQQDMNGEEAGIMKHHVAYWGDMAGRGIALIYGPVLDPKGAYGLGIIEAESDGMAQSLAAEDPAVKSGLLKLEMCPMLATLPGNNM
ncbi:YciI family protein [Pelotomaculum propionicicum]|uniref:YciI family protein n=1 Tax=Pelotomaculum propionicicum TaxID=258475 RepID=UPI003B76A976